MPTKIYLSNGKTIDIVDGKIEDEVIDNALNVNKKNISMSNFIPIFGGLSGVAIALLPYYLRKIPK